jgi:PAS domain S-box-containing protein
VHDWEVRLQPASGDPVSASLSAAPVLGQELRPVAVQWVLRDVSRQAAAELALLRSERLLRRFVEQYLDGIALTDEQGLLVEWNQAMEQITGLPASETRGRPIWDVQFRLGSEAERTPAAYERLKASLQDLLRGGQAPWLGQVFERGYTRPDGAVRILEGVVFPIKSDKGFMLGSVTRDITGRRQAEDERERLLAQATQERERAEQLGLSLEDERNTFAVVIESTHTQLAYLDPQFNFLLVNSAYTKGSGHTREEMIGRNHFDLFPDAENQAIFERVRDTGVAARFSAKAFRFADQPERGVTYWDWSLVPVRRAAGQIQGLVLSLLDVSEQIRARLQIEALSAQSQRQADELTAILNAIPESVAVWDVEGKLARANPASAAFGIGPGAVEAGVLFREADVRAADGRAMAHRESVVAQPCTVRRSWASRRA